MWSADAIVHAAAEGLRVFAEALDAEQAVHGVDALEEIDLHPVIGKGLTSAGWGLAAEQPYPSSPLARPQDRDRLRCDLVLLPRPGQILADSILQQRERDRAATTLFAEVAERMMPDVDAVDPREAMWIEVKAVGQFTPLRGASDPNPTYGSEMVRGPLADLRKLAGDPIIEHAGAMLIVMCERPEVAEHDLGIVTHRCLDAGLNVAAPVIASIPIVNRMGNACAAVGLIRLRR